MTWSRPREMGFGLFAICLIVSCGSSNSGQTSSTQQGVRFDETRCPFVVDTSHIQGKTIRCGILYTPQVHANPNRLIEVPVLIFKGRGFTEPPVVYLSGGPGQSWADLGLETITAADTKSMGRDQIFIEQRGTGLSRPRLDCPVPRDNETAADYYTRCVSNLEAQGVDLAAYNTEEMAQDVDTLQSVLGYPKIILDGVSYGTAWGLQFMREHSSRLVAAYLDSVVSPTIPVYSASASARNDAFSAAFSACAGDAECTTGYGDLEAKMIAALASLKAQALTMAGTGASYDDESFFSDAVSMLAFAPTLLPRMINSVSAATLSANKMLLFDSEVTPYISVENNLLSSSSEGQFFSVDCSDNQFVTAQMMQADLSKVRPAFFAYLDDREFIDLCRLWPYQKRQSALTAVTSTVPTLLLSGSFDPLTSPTWGEQAARTLVNGHWVEFPGLGHSVSTSSNSCVDSVASSFGATRQLDTTCVSKMTIAFAAPVQSTTVVYTSRASSTRSPTISDASSLARFTGRLMRRRQLDNLLMRRHVQQKLLRN